MDDQIKTCDENELQLAAAVQEALLTDDVPRCKCGRMVLKNLMSGQVGGDFYHFRSLGEGQIAFTMGDVEGHGMGAALLMSMILGMLRADRRDFRRPSSLVGSLNDMLIRLGGKLTRPITCSLIYGVLDLPSGILLYVNAGHPRPIISNRGDGEIRQLPPTTMLLGVQGGVMPESCHQFRQKDRLVLFTDGIVDAWGADAQLFSEGRLQNIVRQMSQDEPEDLAEKVFAELKIFCGDTRPTDDQTLVVIDFDKISEGG